MLCKANRMLVAALAAAGIAYASGCGREDAKPAAVMKPAEPSMASPVEPAKPKLRDDEHGHVGGAHGGIIVSIGQDNYHAEAVFENDGVLRLFMLGNDESKVIEIDAQKLVAFVKPEGEKRSTSIVLRPESQPGDSSGKTSQFVGHLPSDVAGKNVEVVIPSVRIGEERFRIGFKSDQAESNGHGEPMPDKVADERERDLYLTPGGLYTEADIASNGRKTASERFAGFKPAHDLHPQLGDKICPISLTKSNPQCTWVVGGKTYEFCCPPCVDEFVTLAKTKPEAIKEPESYVK